MYFAVRFAGRMLHRSSAGAIANSALVTRHRFISSGSSTAAGKGHGKRSGSPTAVEAVEVTETVPAGPAGGSKAEQGTVKLDICGDIEGVRSFACAGLWLGLVGNSVHRCRHSLLCGCTAQQYSSSSSSDRRTT